MLFSLEAPRPDLLKRLYSRLLTKLITVNEVINKSDHSSLRKINFFFLYKTYHPLGIP